MPRPHVQPDTFFCQYGAKPFKLVLICTPRRFVPPFLGHKMLPSA
jgi:hypothetical protein